MPSEEKKGIIVLVGTTMIFAVMGFFPRFFDESFTVLQQTYIRIFLATILCYLIFYKSIKIQKFFQLPRKEFCLLAFRGFLNYLGVVFFSLAVLKTTLLNTSVVTLIPSISILSIIFLNEKLTIQKFTVILCSILGLFFIGKGNFSFGIGEGELYALIGDILFGIAYLSRKAHDETKLSNKELTFGMLFFGFLGTFLLSSILGENLEMKKSFLEINFLLILFLSALANIVITLGVNYGFSKVSGILADRLMTLEVVFAFIFGYLFYSEIPNYIELFGTSLIIGSILYLQKLEYKK